MPVSYTKTSGQGHVYQVPDYPEAADGPKAFKDFADYLDLILPPVGTIMPFVGSSAPTGWLLCDGGSYSSTTYPKLSALCGTKFGTTTAGNFKVPDLKGRSIAGFDSSQTEFDTVGKTGGAKSVTLTVSNMPEHNHTLSAHTHTGNTTDAEAAHTHTVTGSIGGDGGHGHTGYTDAAVSNLTWSQDSTQSGTGVQRAHTLSSTRTNLGVWIITSPTQGSHTHTFSGSAGSGTAHSHGFTVASGGAGTTGNAGTASPTAVSVLNPYLTLNHIIRAA